MRTKPNLSLIIRRGKKGVHTQLFLYGVLVYQTFDRPEKALDVLGILDRVSRNVRKRDLDICSIFLKRLRKQRKKEQKKELNRDEQHP